MKPHNRVPHSPARALLVIDQPLLAGVVEMALNHGTYTTRVAVSAPEAADALKDWQPHLAVIDMDVDDGEIVKWLEQTQALSERIPLVALTRRGDLRTKLAAANSGSIYGCASKSSASNSRQASLANTE